MVDDAEADSDGDLSVLTPTEIRRLLLRRERADTASERQRELEALIAAQKKADSSAERARILHQMELKLVQMIGIDGDTGEFGAVVRRLDEQEKEIKMIVEELRETDLFVKRIKWTIVIVTPIAGIITAVVTALILKRIQ